MHDWRRIICRENRDIPNTHQTLKDALPHGNIFYAKQLKLFNSPSDESRSDKEPLIRKFVFRRL